MTQDEPVCKEITGGQRQAFQRFVTEHRKKIFHLAYDLTGSLADAEDLSQEVFLKAHRALHQFREDASMYTWLYRITVTTFIDQKRKKSAQAEKRTEELDETRLGHVHDQTGQAWHAPERHYQDEQTARQVELALQILSPKERSVFVLKHQSELRIDEIATLLEIAPGTVKSFLFRATQKLRAALAEGYLGRQGQKGDAP